MTPGGWIAVLLVEVDPELQRAGHARLIECRLRAGRVHQLHIVRRGQALEQPIRKARRRNFDRPLADVAGGIALNEFLAVGDQFVPGVGRLVGIKSRRLERVLVPVHHDGRALERNTPGFIAGLAVRHEGRIERFRPRFVGIGFQQIVERRDSVLVDQREHVGRQQHGDVRRLAALERRERLHQRVLVGAGIDRLDGDAGIFLLEVGDIAVDDLWNRPADGDRIIERQRDVFCRRHGSQRHQGGADNRK